MTEQKQIKEEEKFELIFLNIFPNYMMNESERKEVRDFIQNVRKQALEEGRKQALEEVEMIIDIFARAKIKWAEKPQTILNKALVDLLVTWEKELKFKIKQEMKK